MLSLLTRVRRRFLKGFTLIELVIVIIILGILAAVAIPSYVDLTADATTASINAANNGIKSGWVIAIARKQGTPTLQEVVDELTGGAVASTGGSGIEVIIAGATYVANTYQDVCGGLPTNSPTSPVACIEDLA